MGATLYKKIIAEFIGTFAMVFCGCGAVMMHSLHPEAMPLHAIPIVFGLVIAAMIYAIGHISGAHFNPTVTIAFAIIKRFDWKEVTPYLLGQFLGALAGMTILVNALPETSLLGTTTPSVTTMQAFIWEFILTFFLMFVITAVATDSRAVGTMAGATIGATVMLDAFIGGPITGASMNPARSFAPAVFAGEYRALWVYFVAPTLGAASAALLYESIRCDKDTDQKTAKGCC